MFKSAIRRPNRPVARTRVPRRETRVEVTKSASICMADGTVISCTLRDIHSRGARLSVINPVGIPDEFILKSRSENLETRAKVAWRRGNEIGVMFTTR